MQSGYFSSAEGVTSRTSSQLLEMLERAPKQIRVSSGEAEEKLKPAVVENVEASA
jgi:hypothetical protein